MPLVRERLPCAERLLAVEVHAKTSRVGVREQDFDARKHVHPGIDSFSASLLLRSASARRSRTRPASRVPVTAIRLAPSVIVTVAHVGIGYTFHPSSRATTQRRGLACGSVSRGASSRSRGSLQRVSLGVLLHPSQNRPGMADDGAVGEFECR